MSTLAAVAVREEAARFLVAFATVYSLLILGQIAVSLVLALGGRLPALRPVELMIRFLHEVCEPFLRLFRRLIPPIGPLDLSPIVALLVVQLGARLLASVVAG